MSYQTRALDYSPDKEFLSNAVQEFLSNSQFTRDTVRWNYESNPVKNATGHVLQHIDESQTASNAGVISIVYRTMYCQGEKQQAALCGDFVVLPDHRSLQPALKLIREASQSELSNCPFIYGFPNEKAVGVLKMAGFKVIGKMSRYAYILKTGKYLQDVIKVPILPTLLGGCFDLLRNTLVHTIDVMRTRNYHIEEAREFTAEVDSILEKSDFNNLIINAHEHTYLNWRYFNRPGKRYTGLILRNTKTKAAEAIALLEMNSETQVLHVRDLAALNGHALSKVLTATRIWAYHNDAGSISMSLLGPESIVAIVKTSGFIWRESIRHVCVKTSNSDIAALVGNPDAWFFMDGDEDQ